MVVSTFFTIISNKQLQYLQANEYVPFESSDKLEERIDMWMLEQMKKRLPSSSFNIGDKNNINVNSNLVGPHWLFIHKEDINWDFHIDHVVLEISKNNNDCLFFDDNDWVTVANNILNNDYFAYLAYSQQEADANQNASKEEIQTSWERMFHVYENKRDETYCGPLEIRAVTPFIHISDIIKIHRTL